MTPIAVTVYIFFIASTYATNFKDCGSVSGTINSVVVKPCAHEPCNLIRGTNVTVDVNFTPHVSSSTATTVVHGIIGGLPLPFLDVQSHSCNVNLPCPIVKDTPVTYSSYVPVRPEYPLLRLIVQWEIRDQNNKPMVCFVMPAAIASTEPVVIG